MAAGSKRLPTSGAAVTRDGRVRRGRRRQHDGARRLGLAVDPARRLAEHEHAARAENGGDHGDGGNGSRAHATHCSHGLWSDRPSAPFSRENGCGVRDGRGGERSWPPSGRASTRASPCRPSRPPARAQSTAPARCPRRAPHLRGRSARRRGRHARAGCPGRRRSRTAGRSRPPARRGSRRSSPRGVWTRALSTSARPTCSTRSSSPTATASWSTLNVEPVLAALGERPELRLERLRDRAEVDRLGLDANAGRHRAA